MDSTCAESPEGSTESRWRLGSRRRETLANAVGEIVAVKAAFRHFSTLAALCARGSVHYPFGVSLIVDAAIVVVVVIHAGELGVKIASVRFTERVWFNTRPLPSSFSFLRISSSGSSKSSGGSNGISPSSAFGSSLPDACSPPAPALAARTEASGVCSLCSCFSSLGDVSCVERGERR